MISFLKGLPSPEPFKNSCGSCRRFQIHSLVVVGLGGGCYTADHRNSPPPRNLIMPGGHKTLHGICQKWSNFGPTDRRDTPRPRNPMMSGGNKNIHKTCRKWSKMVQLRSTSVKEMVTISIKWWPFRNGKWWPFHNFDQKWWPFHEMVTISWPNGYHFLTISTKMTILKWWPLLDHLRNGYHFFKKMVTRMVTISTNGDHFTEMVTIF